VRSASGRRSADTTGRRARQVPVRAITWARMRSAAGRLAR
jgi:hypothetical protein